MNYLDTKGRIFDIQRFSVHDGEGIRTIVFLKGCILRCKWCCNPEGQEFKIQTMMQNGVPKTMGIDTTVREVMETVERDRVYYKRSEGGLTLSGGECLCQADFAAGLLRASKEAGLTTAIETTACVHWSEIEKVLPYVDMFLMDIKHMNSAKHQEYTKQPNEMILENAKKLSSVAKGLTIRVPVIPGFNDTTAEIYEIAAFAEGLPLVKELHLLPYHRLGQDKYYGLDRNYDMGEAPLLDKQKMEALKEAASKTRLKVQIGG